MADVPVAQTQESGGGEGISTSIQVTEPTQLSTTDPKPIDGSPSKTETTSQDVTVAALEVKSEKTKTEDVDTAPSAKPVKDIKEIISGESVNKENDQTETLNIREAEVIDEEWKKREQELLQKIEELQKVKDERSENGLKLEIKVREEEIDLLKARVKNLETELQAAFSKPGAKNEEMIEHIKQQHEELLTKARGMIFDKTKMVKNQELQIEALTTQVQSLKDINLITKDLLEIRNSEVKAMEDRLEAMEARFKGEKERYGLVLQRAQTSSTINDDLRREYETQLALFKELREKYEQRVQALVGENERLKASLQGGAASG